MRVEPVEDGLRAVDAAKHSITVRTEDWEDSGASTPPSLPDALADLDVNAVRRPDTIVTGRTAALEFPPYYLIATDIDTGETYDVGPHRTHTSLPAATYVVRLNGNPLVYVAFEGACELTLRGYESARLSFPEPASVAVGFTSSVQSDAATVTVERSPEGVAAALSALSAGNRTTTADRSFPSMRGHPPLIEFGEERRFPDEVAERPESNVEVVVPPSLDRLLPVAPLATYLDATVRVEADTDPRVTAPGVSRSLPTDDGFAAAVASLTERTFYLDCVVRTAGPYSGPLDTEWVLDELGLDASALYGAPIGDRLAAYLDADFDAVADAFPEWHHTLYVEPSYEHVRTLPYVVNGLPHVFEPRSTPLDDERWLSRSLSDVYRGATEAASVDLVDPRLGPGTTHGWLADGVPIDVYKTLPEAYENRDDYLDESVDATRVTAIVNDREMRTEHDDAAAIYRRKADRLDLDVTVREFLTVDELASVFESRTDFVHYIGHCETDGLTCADGYLSVDQIDRSRAQTFFLNACGSFHEGVELVRKGSVAGGVTFNEVLDSQAATVGTSFARLMTNGYCMERALDHSRRQIMTGKDYAVVGDGTHRLTQSTALAPADIEVSIEGDEYRVTHTAQNPHKAGSEHQCIVRTDGQFALTGTREEYLVDEADLRELVENADGPIIVEGRVYWPDRLLATDEVRDVVN
ncbi:hypothetical protein Hbl1158_08695 [Halobaculum sp. CBA1158]|uniref:hypothetical protein n=1 Tax=Halobaculum sp. CBA1158 TaxID=2904243 RepID=UPI001F1D5007|nr:hypothetical protein [Halobaculum sp. CBA1158]UIO98634.1 hypothetical protein Hbl1158_08695 [Halobaculum sp. CBA1158]